MKIALAQIACSTTDIDANIRAMCALTSRAAEAGCAVVIFPELADTGYSLDDMATRALRWDGANFQSLRSEAQKNRITLVAGLSECDGARIYNSLAVISPTGELLGRYRKQHLMSLPPHRETSIFAPGDTMLTLPMHGATWGLSVCYDLRFPEMYGRLCAQGATVLVNCAAWPAARIAHWDLLCRARAVECQAWFLGVNRVGTDGETTLGGHTCVIDPHGEVVAQATGEELVMGDIDVEESGKFRRSFPALKDRLAGMKIQTSAGEI